MVYRMPVILKGPFSGEAVNVWHFRKEDVAGGSPVAAIRKFYERLAVNVVEAGSILASGTRITAPVAVDVETETVIDPGFDPLTVEAGHGMAPVRLAICVTWRSSLAARRGRGRTFVGPLGGQVVHPDGSVKPQALTAVKTAADELVNTSLVDGNGAVGVWGLDHKGGLPDAPHVLRDIVAASVKQDFATLRSRS